MLQATNQKEHTRAFIKFVLLFLAALAVLMLVSFFGTRMPHVENAHLRSTLQKSQGLSSKLNSNQDKALETVKSLDSTFDIVTKAPEKWGSVTKTEAQAQMVKLNQQMGDSATANEALKIIYGNFLSLMEVLDGTATVKQENIAVKKENAAVKKELDEVKQELKDEKRRSMGM